MSLLKSLGIERDRWQNTSEGFKSQMATLVGDVFLSSAFLSYAGYFDQQSRQNLFTAWKHHLDMANILYRHDIGKRPSINYSPQFFSFFPPSLSMHNRLSKNLMKS